MKTMSCWLLYSDPDHEVNRAFASFFVEEGKRRGFAIRPVLLSELRLSMDDDNRPRACLADGAPPPELVISRQRDPFISRHFEAMGIPVFNNAKVCALCNDKRETRRFLQGLPMLPSAFPLPGQTGPSPGTAYPLVLKPAFSHGGDRVFWVNDKAQWQEAAGQIAPEPLVEEQAADQPGLDLRVYVVFGQIVAGVLRQAKSGFLSNFKQGGHVSLHALTQTETALAREAVARFAEAGAPLAFAGIDFLYHKGQPVLSEVEDVVGSRMLYEVSDINIVGLYLDGLQERFLPHI